MVTTRDEIMLALRDCYDPCCRDRGISVVDMGLIHDVRIEESNVEIDMLLTTGWCPFVVNLYQMIEERLKQCDGVENVKVEVLWDPVWTMDRLSESARHALIMPLEPLLPYRDQRLVLNKEIEL
ncbi:MAG: metal-sulfur cluster assembly factor [Chloroflexi bacterium]|nr:metal-sulfur cluster assembly factor [Chloroflexota bacterium]